MGGKGKKDRAVVAEASEEVEDQDQDEEGQES